MNDIQGYQNGPIESGAKPRQGDVAARVQSHQSP